MERLGIGSGSAGGGVKVVNTVWVSASKETGVDESKEPEERESSEKGRTGFKCAGV